MTPLGVLKLQSYTFLAYGTAFVFAPNLMVSLYFKPEKVKKDRITEIAVINCGVYYISSCLIFLKIIDKVEPSIQKYMLGINGACNIALTLTAVAFKDLYKPASFKQIILLLSIFSALNINAYRKIKL